MAKSEQVLTIALDNLVEEALEIVEEEVIELHNGLVDAGQAVWDSGEFKNSFAPVIKLSDTVWRIENDADHSSILYRGRREVAGRSYGSLKWADGIDPMIDKMLRNIERRTDAIRT